MLTFSHKNQHRNLRILTIIIISNQKNSNFEPEKSNSISCTISKSKADYVYWVFNCIHITGRAHFEAFLSCHYKYSCILDVVELFTLTWTTVLKDLLLSTKPSESTLLVIVNAEILLKPRSTVFFFPNGIIFSSRQSRYN